MPLPEIPEPAPILDSLPPYSVSRATGFGPSHGEIFVIHSLLCPLFLITIPILPLGPLGGSRIIPLSPDQEISTHYSICNFDCYFPCNVMYSEVLGINTGISSAGGSSFQLPHKHNPYFRGEETQCWRLSDVSEVIGWLCGRGMGKYDHRVKQEAIVRVCCGLEVGRILTSDPCASKNHSGATFWPSIWRNGLQGNGL